jgi:hypothetical protein
VEARIPLSRRTREAWNTKGAKTIHCAFSLASRVVSDCGVGLTCLLRCRISHGGRLDTVPLSHEILAVAEQRAESQLLAGGPGDLAFDDLGVAREGA